jgi:hypothetical protein
MNPLEDQDLNSIHEPAAAMPGDVQGYMPTPLPCPFQVKHAIKDAQALSALLTKAGFRVLTSYDHLGEGMRSTMVRGWVASNRYMPK